MKPTAFVLTCAAALTLCADPVMAVAANQTVLNFDDIAGSGAMPSGYGDFDWPSWSHCDQDPNGRPYFAHSTDARAAASNNVNSITSVMPVVFDGSWISGVASSTLHYQLWFGGVIVANLAAFHPNNVEYAWQPSGYSGSVESLVVIANNATIINHFVTADFTFHQSSADAEPSSSALMATAILLMLGRALRQ